MATRQDAMVLESSTVTRWPRYEEYADLGGPNEPGEDFDFAVDGVAVGGTYWCGSRDIPDGERWASWGPAGSSSRHYSREDAEQVQIAAYLEKRRASNEPGTFSVGIYLSRGGFLVEVQAWTWAHAQQIAQARWAPVHRVRILDEDDRTDDLERVDVDVVDGLLERRHLHAAAEARRRLARAPWARERRKRLLKEWKLGVRYTPEGRKYGTPRSGPDDRRFSREQLPADVFGANAEAVFAVLERASYWTWDDALHVIGVMKRRPPVEDRWGWEQHGLRVWEAAKAAGELREAEYIVLPDEIRNLRMLIAPVEAARKASEYSAETSLWDEVFGEVLSTARVYLVAGRPELPRATFERLSWVWRTAFPDDPIPELDGPQEGAPRC